MMKFNLQNDLCFFDLEATGLNVITDRIVQIGILKYKADGSEPEEFETLVNPGVPISPDAMAVHGITPQDVARKPSFAQIAEDVLRFIGDSDIAGYNSNRFDIPMLQEELYRAGHSWDLDSRNIIDVQKIFYKMEPRTLSAAYKFYCDKEIVNAHDAMADVRATAEVLMGQLDRYQDTNFLDRDEQVHENPVRNDMKALHDFTYDSNIIDGTRRLKYDKDRNVVFNFGKYKDQKVGEVCFQDRNYYNWILNKEFAVQVKSTVKKELDKMIKKHG